MAYTDPFDKKKKNPKATSLGLGHPSRTPQADLGSKHFAAVLCYLFTEYCPNVVLCAFLSSRPRKSY